MVLLVILKCKTLMHQDSINKAKRQVTDWHKIVTADPGLELSQISKNDTINPRKHSLGYKGNSQERKSRRPIKR